jgi:hypothetical protein
MTNVMEIFINELPTSMLLKIEYGSGLGTWLK